MFVALTVNFKFQIMCQYYLFCSPTDQNDCQLYEKPNFQTFPHQKHLLTTGNKYGSEDSFYPLTLSQTSLVFTYLQYKSFENTGRKGEIALNKQFLLLPQFFLPIWRTFFRFLSSSKLSSANSFSSKGQKFVLW